MSMHRASREFSDYNELSEPRKATLLSRFLGLLAKIFSGPKGPQGGWEGGARGL
jgi:hypothetical protein